MTQELTPWFSGETLTLKDNLSGLPAALYNWRGLTSPSVNL